MYISPQSYYELLLETFRAQGVKIIHRKLNGAGGLYCPKSNNITIGTEYRNTLEGCNYLCHEMAHHTQNRYNNFPEFFNLPAEKVKFDEKLFELILEAEMDAVKRANVTLKMFGIPFTPPELTKKGYEHAKNFWKSYYFKE
jgi:hypothetical protein